MVVQGRGLPVPVSLLSCAVFGSYPTYHDVKVLLADLCVVHVLVQVVWYR